MFKIIKKILYNDFGKYIISIILGIGLASLFRKACKDRNCLLFKGPLLDDIKNNVYNYESKCYQFREQSSKCNSKEQTIEFA